MKNGEEQQKQLFIPDKVRVGYQKRDGTYTGKLAYVIYYDQKGELRKAKSWESWRDKKITADDFPNEPTDGFVLNKKVGGHKSHWNFRDAHVRVYDPRGFEFEISVPNLLFILREGDCSRGKGLEGKFVYAWDGTELVLLPVHSEDYKHSKDFTTLQDKKVGVKNLVEGMTYITKKQEVLTYIGKFDYNFMVEWQYHYHYPNNDYRQQRQMTLGPKTKADAKGVFKQFVFWNGTDFVFMKEVKTIAVQKGDTAHPDFADLVDKYNKSAHGSKVVKLYLKDVADRKIPKEEQRYGYSEPWYFEDTDGSFVQCTTLFKREQTSPYGMTDKIERINAQFRFSIKDGVFTQEPYNNHNSTVNVDKHPPTTLRLFAETENGGKHRVDKGDKRYGYFRYFPLFAKEK